MPTVDLNKKDVKTYKEAITVLKEWIYEPTVSYNLPRNYNVHLRGLISYLDAFKDEFVNEKSD